jgi:hypothetical protein
MDEMNAVLFPPPPSMPPSQESRIPSGLLALLA